MPNTFELIASSTVGAGGAASIDFTSIPATFTDLCVKYSVRTSISSPYANVNIKFNGSSSSYTMIRLVGDGSSAASYSNTEIFDVAVGSTATASTFSNAEFYIPNYAGSTNKSVSGDAVGEHNATTSQAMLYAGLWSNTAAINQVTLTPTSGTFLQYTTAYLYGVKNA